MSGIDLHPNDTITVANQTADPLNQYFDRADSVIKSVDASSTNISPHSATVRGTYTVPTGKQFYLEAASLQLIIITTASPPGAKAAFLNRDDFLHRVMQSRLASIFNTVGLRSTFVQHSGSLVADAGDVLELETFDLGTGGTVDYNLMFNGREFTP